ncbi:DUF5085 family protein [Bhargavaea massiliensis]|uniref:DUF5085 family protein n=1 Tax=Bhargavaea massiliensis TaxID=2697500 RepID=UPI001BCE01AE|nr:DUF5085 family protein [Bhargavaea massiliensis]
MAMERRPLVFDRVLTYQTEQRKADWQEPISALETLLLDKGVYQNGPIFFTFQGEEGAESGTFTYYLPVSEQMTIEEDNGFGYMERFHSGDALVMRQAEQEADFDAAFAKVQAYAEQEGIVLGNTYYCVLIDVYGDIIIDLAVPVEGGRPE